MRNSTREKNGKVQREVRGWWPGGSWRDGFPLPRVSSRVLHPVNLGVDRLAGSVCHLVPQVSDDVLEAALQHSPHFDHGFQPAAHRPVVPSAKVLARRPFIRVLEHRHGGFFQVKEREPSGTRTRFRSQTSELIRPK